MNILEGHLTAGEKKSFIQSDGVSKLVSFNASTILTVSKYRKSIKTDEFGYGESKNEIFGKNISEKEVSLDRG